MMHARPSADGTLRHRSGRRGLKCPDGVLSADVKAVAIVQNSIPGLADNGQETDSELLAGSGLPCTQDEALIDRAQGVG